MLDGVRSLKSKKHGCATCSDVARGLTCLAKIQKPLWFRSVRKIISMENTNDRLSKEGRDFAEKSLAESIELVEKENELINHRLNWGLLFQGLLFASVFIGGDSVPNFIVINSVSELVHSTQTLGSLSVINTANWFIAPMGMLSCASIFLGTLFAHFVINREIVRQGVIQSHYERPISGPKAYHTVLTYMAPHFALPVIGFATWIGLAAQGWNSLMEDQCLHLTAIAVWAASAGLIALAIWFTWRGRSIDKDVEKKINKALSEQLKRHSK